LAALADRRGVPEDPSDIVVASGARQAITLVVRAIVRPGDTVACESPSFFAVIEAVRATGARVLPVPVDEDGLDTEALEQLLRQHEIKLVALQSRIQNPTGRDLSAERRSHLVALARRHGFFVLDDGVYADLRFEGEGPPGLRAEAPDHVVCVDSLSKTLAPGMRIGWVTASGPVVDRVAREKRADDIHSTTTSQMVAARYLAAGKYEPLLQRSFPVYEVRCDVLLDAVRS
jgi:2-aminoadipate transaminase